MNGKSGSGICGMNSENFLSLRNFVVPFSITIKGCVVKILIAVLFEEFKAEETSTKEDELVDIKNVGTLKIVCNYQEIIH